MILIAIGIFILYLVQCYDTLEPCGLEGALTWRAIWYRGCTTVVTIENIVGYLLLIALVLFIIYLVKFTKERRRFRKLPDQHYDPKTRHFVLRKRFVAICIILGGLIRAYIQLFIGLQILLEF